MDPVHLFPLLCLRLHTRPVFPAKLFPCLIQRPLHIRSRRYIPDIEAKEIRKASRLVFIRKRFALCRFVCKQLLHRRLIRQDNHVGTQISSRIKAQIRRVQPPGHPVFPAEDRHAVPRKRPF